ncbi:hypothetical protein Bpfe_020411 [Biomphalaria pfeifferi]|uniref:Uncharacterized protein n=1 Tax=Biomphalaria pfeifferi TaxID=112525 RepID=A0AAD8F4C7_BIOPF|nr:hypothetical protein Bpfe_020411 [Biomphalaria pfeifferi]
MRILSFNGQTHNWSLGNIIKCFNNHNLLFIFLYHRKYLCHIFQLVIFYCCLASVDGVNRWHINTRLCMKICRIVSGNFS